MITIDSGRPKAAWGSATPSGLLSRFVCRRTMKSGRMATATGNRSPRVKRVDELASPERVPGEHEARPSTPRAARRGMVSMAMSVLFHLAPERARLQDRRVVARHPWIGHAGRVVDELQVRPEAAEHRERDRHDDEAEDGDGHEVEPGAADPPARARSDGAAAHEGASHRDRSLADRAASPAAGRAARRSARGRRSQPRPRWRSRTGPCGSCRRGTSPSSTRR